MTDQVRDRFKVSRQLLAIYVILYTLVGFAMHFFGDWAKIARFASVYQVFSCYVIMMVPISLLIREFRWYDQYAYGFVAIAVIEFVGYGLGTSIAFEGNILDKLFGPHNFTLAMSLFVAFYFPLGNWAVAKIHGWLSLSAVAQVRT